MDGWVIIAAATVALVVVLVAFWAVDGRMLPAASRASTVLLDLGIALAGAIPWLIFEPLVTSGASGMLYLPVAVLGAVAAFIATIAVRAAGARPTSSIVFAFVWSALVFAPAAVVSFTRIGALEFIGISPIDHGGSLAANVAAGAAALAVMLVSRGSRRRLADVPFALSVVAVVALCVAWLGWLVWAELAVDAATPAHRAERPCGDRWRHAGLARGAADPAPGHDRDRRRRRPHQRPDRDRCGRSAVHSRLRGNRRRRGRGRGSPRRLRWRATHAPTSVDRRRHAPRCRGTRSHGSRVHGARASECSTTARSTW